MSEALGDSENHPVKLDEAEQSKDLGRLAMQDNGSRGDWPC
jgi:hypothetical protein